MPLEEIALTSYGQSSTRPAPVNQMMANFAADFRDGIDINLGVGYVDESTIPRQAFEEAVSTVLAKPEKYRAAFNYGGPAGSANLIESIRRFHLDRQLGGLTEEQLRQRDIIVGPNGATSLLESIASVLKRGIVIVADPMYYIYCNYLDRLGFEVLPIPEDGEGMSADLLLERINNLGERRREISFVYVVTVHNPTGTILTTRRRRELVAAVTQLSHEEGRKIPLVVDKAYEDLIHDPAVEKPDSALVYNTTGIVFEIGTLSKILAPALRIGYLIGPPGDFANALVQRTSDAGFSAPLINQEIASYLLDHCAATQIEEVNRGYRDKALMVGQWIDEKLGNAVAERRGGQAGFYYYLSLDGIETGLRSALFRWLSRTTGDERIDGPPICRKPRVAYIPGEFCVHAHGDLVEAGGRQLRISYGFEGLDQIAEALDLMREAVEVASPQRQR